MPNISNNDDTIDTRDLAALIADLESERDNEGFGLDEEGLEELRLLSEFAEQVEPYCSDYRYGETLIRDSYFEEYARELADEFINLDHAPTRWPFTCIDWSQAANELQQDYTSAEFDGVTYWFR